MKRLLIAAAFAAVALSAVVCGGCTPLQTVTANHGILEGQKVDEQILGGVYALGASANVLIEATAKSGVATRAQLVKGQELRAGIDAGVAAAQAAYDVGDAKSFNDRVATLTDLNKRATALFNEVKR